MLRVHARVVIVEDHALVREGIRRVVQASGAALVVGEADDGAEAVQLAWRLRPDVVLMDVSLPRMNGIEATRRIKENRPSTAVLMLTAFEDEAYVLASLGAGASGYLLKTARGDELARAIRDVQAGRLVFPTEPDLKMIEPPRLSPPAEVSAQVGCPLSEREWEALSLAAVGLTNKGIAERLGISVRTVENHIANCFPKLGAGNRTEAVHICLRRGWLQLKRIA
jgi:two-component system, NarL family, response regulator LiaR